MEDSALRVEMLRWLDAAGDRGARLAAGLTPSERRVVNALRQRPRGTILPAVAALSGVSCGHVRRCLRKLAELGVVSHRTRACRWGYGTVKRRLWGLTYSSACVELLAHVQPEPVNPLPEPYPDMVPPQFWSLFWSTPAQDLRVSEHGLFIAQTLINGPDPTARLWALVNLPVGVLEECQRLRGGGTEAAVDAFVSSRRAVD